MVGGPVVTRAITLTGSINGLELEVRGMIRRKGPNSSDPPGPCKNCSRMIALGNTDLLLKFGVYCRYAGGSMKGHIQLFPAALKEIFESDTWSSKFRFKRRANVAADQRPATQAAIVGINQNAKQEKEKKR